VSLNVQPPPLPIVTPLFAAINAAIFFYKTGTPVLLTPNDPRGGVLTPTDPRYVWQKKGVMT